MSLQEIDLETAQKIKELMEQNDFKTADKLLKQHFDLLRHRVTVLQLDVEKKQEQAKQISETKARLKLELENKQEQVKQINETKARPPEEEGRFKEGEDQRGPCKTSAGNSNYCQ